MSKVISPFHHFTIPLFTVSAFTLLFLNILFYILYYLQQGVQEEGDWMEIKAIYFPGVIA
jgi:hypothetical protein